MESWLPILITPTLTNGYDLPIKLSRVALKKTLQGVTVSAWIMPKTLLP